MELCNYRVNFTAYRLDHNKPDFKKTKGQSDREAGNREKMSL